MNSKISHTLRGPGHTWHQKFKNLENVTQKQIFIAWDKFFKTYLILKEMSEKFILLF
jgi:hypothetical protein